MGASATGAGVGVGQREKGFEDGESMDEAFVVADSVVDVDDSESVDRCRELVMVLRRKERAGTRYVGKTAGGSEFLRKRDISARVSV